ncbi:methyl jasmonate esterase 1-like isoform X1 [Arachis stenosperma]|uniref:methyl jasmonate esterase 1-like isoform X1 n=2 Tax=Arachis stenosperma TaxID=217475 RepID=UPI0025AC3956|nr:methyl jasmonate esterase 1-like isoform X1 [Arachis stenosperma]
MFVLLGCFLDLRETQLTRGSENLRRMERHFVLVHGVMHGAWCWYKVATLLQSVGHKVTSLDMAASGIHPKQASEVNSYREYVEPLTQFMKALPSHESVILVGHSAGGGCISVAMEQFPEKVSVAVFVAALMPGPNITFAALTKEFIQQLGKAPSNERPDKKLSSTEAVTWHDLSGPYNQLSPPEDVMLSKLSMRPSPSFNDYELFDKQTTFTKENFGKVRRVYIMGDQDMLMKEDFQKWMIELHPPNEFKKIDGSDHFLMFSTPIQLFSCLQDISHKYY